MVEGNGIRGETATGNKQQAGKPRRAKGRRVGWHKSETSQKKQPAICLSIL
ncbi:MAG: hypothetical protein LBL13_00410 [Bacteroidales bacterium]|nr:hypothetical protein [Bacteroidales bacterium]